MNYIVPPSKKSYPETSTPEWKDKFSFIGLIFVLVSCFMLWMDIGFDIVWFLGIVVGLILICLTFIKPAPFKSPEEFPIVDTMIIHANEKSDSEQKTDPNRNS